MPAEPPHAAVDVQRLATLARLRLDADEAQAMQRDMAKILAHCQKLVELGLGDTPVTDHLPDAAAPLRADAPRPQLSVEAALAAAPERLGDGFGVPKMIE